MKGNLEKYIKYQREVRKGNADNEYYTRKEDIDNMLPEFDLSDKIIYCPCDSDQSEFVKYFKQPGKCKELIYTSDDFRNHEDLFEKCDVVVTNPPFTHYGDFWKYIKGDYILITLIVPAVKISNDKIKTVKFYNEVRWFNRPDGSLHGLRCQWISNLSGSKHPEGYSFRELYCKELPLNKDVKPMRSGKLKLTKKQRELIDFEPPERVNVYGKKTGYPIDEDIFVVTVNTLCSDFIYHALNVSVYTDDGVERGLGCSLVSLKK